MKKRTFFDIFRNTTEEMVSKLDKESFERWHKRQLRYELAAISLVIIMMLLLFGGTMYWMYTLATL